MKVKSMQEKVESVENNLCRTNKKYTQRLKY